MADVRLKSMADLDSAELAERTRQLIVAADLSVSEISILTQAKYSPIRRTSLPTRSFPQSGRGYRPISVKS